MPTVGTSHSGLSLPTSLRKGPQTWPQASLIEVIPQLAFLFLHDSSLSSKQKANKQKTITIAYSRLGCELRCFRQHSGCSVVLTMCCVFRTQAAVKPRGTAWMSTSRNPCICYPVEFEFLVMFRNLSLSKVFDAAFSWCVTL